MRPAKDKIIKAVIYGIEEAQNFYEQCSGGYWLWRAPEYLICASIAKCLYKEPGAIYVTLESNIRQMLKVAGAMAKGAPKKVLKKNGCFDVVVWDNASPRAAIEVKNSVWTYAQLRKDIDRISTAVQQNNANSSIQFGLVAFYASCADNRSTKARQQLEHLIETFAYSD